MTADARTGGASGRILNTGGVLHPNVEVRLTAFMNAACALLPKRFKPDCCIAATRLAVEVLGSRLKMDVVPLTCEAWVFNAPARAWVESRDWPRNPDEVAEWHGKGCWTVTVGERSATGPGWSGHLVAIVAGRVLIDLSLGQASRPHKLILAHPLVATADADFAVPPPDGGPERELHYNLPAGGKVAYVARHGDHSYRPCKDWGKIGRDRELVSTLAGAVRREEERLTKLK